MTNVKDVPQAPCCHQRPLFERDKNVGELLTYNIVPATSEVCLRMTAMSSGAPA